MYIELETLLNKATWFSRWPLVVQNKGEGDMVPITHNQLLVNSSKITVPAESESSNHAKKLGFLNSQFQSW